jgi:hypothetical protein
MPLSKLSCTPAAAPSCAAAALDVLLLLLLHALLAYPNTH